MGIVYKMNRLHMYMCNKYENLRSSGLPLPLKCTICCVNSYALAKFVLNSSTLMQTYVVQRENPL